MKSKLATVLYGLKHGASMWQVWCDFCEMAAIAISNRVDHVHRDAREAAYLTIARRYERPQLAAFAHAFHVLVTQLETGIDDVLGRTYMELELGDKRGGQFFTPFHVCRLLAETQVDEGCRAKIAGRGYITMFDPAIGAGALPLAMAAALHTAGINYQQTLHVTGQDVDSKAIHMAYTQLALYHVPAVLIVGDALRAQDQGERWYTPAHVWGGWSTRLSKATKEART